MARQLCRLRFRPRFAPRLLPGNMLVRTGRIGEIRGGDAYAPCVPADPAAPAAKASTSAMPPTGDSVAIAGAGAGVVAAAAGVAFAAYRRFKGNM